MSAGVWKRWLAGGLALLLIGLCTNIPARAGMNGDSPSEALSGAVVTLEQALRAALEHYQPYQVARELLSQRRAHRRQAFSAFMPILSLKADFTERTKARSALIGPPPPVTLRPESTEALSATLSQRLFAGGLGLFGWRQASTEVKIGEEGLNQSREETLLSVAQAFYAVLKARTQAELFEAEVKRLGEHRDASAARLRVGDVTKTVLLRAEAELAGARASLIRAQSDLAVAKEELSLLTGLPAEMDVDVPPRQEAPVLASGQLIERAELQHPELLQSRLRQRSATQGVYVAGAEFFPTVSIELTYEHTTQDPSSPFVLKEDRYGMLKLSFPVFEGGLQLARVQEARSQARAAALDTAFTRESVTVGVRKALRELEALDSSLEHVTAQVKFARENYQLVSRQFAVGLAINLDLLDANSELLTAEQNLAVATYDRDVAVLAVYKSIGGLSDHLLGGANAR